MRKQIMFDQETINVVDEYRRKQKPIPNFSKAVREIIKGQKEEKQ